ncbi:hypothetical protein HNI00_03690 [Thermoleptolyngbya oregonensis NK1-22]|uniref:Uncharacterized protein n=1 Tax=Thermoleptolyngbya oregonensis NK1-22 TaxID=2547457 RepID=A0AA96Y307_9CYAN|nr:hypothetical protein [Thermoleptolyngbya oregonensis]WOB42359.1 hypothetical protein HNI00_03690 [Thermoleptolyngbya oregonensis NK1-22]
MWDASGRSPFISLHPYLWAIALHLAAPTPLGDRPSSPCTRTFGRSPPGYLLGRCTLTEICRYSTSAADPKAAGSVRFEPDLEELSLRKWGANRLPNRKLTEPGR